MKKLLVLILLVALCPLGIGCVTENSILFFVGVIASTMILFILSLYYFSQESRYYISALSFLFLLALSVISLKTITNTYYLQSFFMTESAMFFISAWLLFVADITEGPTRPSSYFSLSILFKTALTLSNDLSS